MLSPVSSDAVAVRPVLAPRAGSILGSIFASIDNGMLLTDLEHRSLACNRRFGEIFRVEPSEVVQMGVEELRDRAAPLIVDSDGWRRSLEVIYADPENRTEDEIELVSEDGKRIRRVSVPVYDEEGKVFGRLWTFTDVSADYRRRRNAELVREIGSIWDTDPALTLKRIVQTLCDHYGDTVAKVSILEGDHMRFRFVAGDLGPAAGIQGLALSDTYCQFALRQKSPLLVQDARQSADHQGLLPVALGFCRYLGAPVKDDTGQIIGTICIVDRHVEQTLSDDDLELIHTVAIRISAELSRERYLNEKLAAKDAEHARTQREVEETRELMAAMNSATASMLEERSLDVLLGEQTRLLCGLLGYSSAAILVKRGDGLLRGCVCRNPFTEIETVEFDAATEERLLHNRPTTELSRLKTEGLPLGDLLETPWAVLSGLLSGEWGQAIVALGRRSEPPISEPRHAIQCGALLDHVRLVVAARMLDEEVVHAHEELSTTQQRLVQTEKLSVVGTLAASTAHDIRNIVASLSLLTRPEAGDPEASLAAIREQLDRFNLLALRLLSYAKPRRVERTSVDLCDVLSRVVALTAGQMRVSRVELRLECPTTLPAIVGDTHQLQHLLVNLLLNAVQAMERTGGILVLRAVPGDKTIKLEVIDQGTGISDEMLDRLFEPFASSRSEGFGLGLYSARRIVEAHRGTIAAGRNADLGSTFTVELPVEEAVS